LKGKGVPSLRGSGRGDQHVRVTVEVPTNLSGDQKKKLEEFAKITSDKNYPHQTGFRQKTEK
jgi:molecular chaperone DnaJ